MRAKELVQEGPLDFVKRVGAGISGAMDSNSTFKTGYQQAAAGQQLTDYAKKTYPAWNQAIVSLKQQGVTDPQLGPELVDWATDYFGFQAPPFTGAVSAQSSMEYLKKLWAMKMSPRKSKQSTTPQPASTPEPQQAAAPEPQQAAAPEPATTPVPQQAAAPEPATTPAPQQAAVDPAHAMFKDPAAFKAEWDKFVASKPNYKLIADPALLSVLKNMWMRSGGLKAESKKNKGQRV
jgi:hypothetical protein